jgi:hypothetical protein
VSKVVRLPGALAALGLGIAAGVALVVAVPLVGPVDGGLHLNGATTLRNAVGGLGAPASEYLRWFPVPVPNLLPEFVLALLTELISPEWAERTLILGYVILLPLAFLYALRGITRRADWLALFALPLTFNLPLHYGFYNFSYSIVLFLLVVGFSLRRSARPSASWMTGLGCLLLMTFLTHIVGFVEAVLFVIIVIGWPSIPQGSRHVSLRMISLICGLLVGCAGLTLATGFASPDKLGEKLTQIASTLLLLHGLVTFSAIEVPVVSILALTLFVLTLGVARGRRGGRIDREGDDLLLFSAMSFVALVVAPSHIGFGGSVITERLALFPAIGLVLWLASQQIAAHTLRRAGAGFALVAVALAVVRIPAYQEVGRAVDDFMTASPCVAPGATMIQATLHLPNLDHPSWRLDPLSDEAARVAAETNGIDLGNVEWSVPYYLLRFRASRDPYRWLPNPPGAIEQIPPSFDLAGYERGTGGRIDYVLVAGRGHASRDVLASKQWRHLRMQLGQMYQLVYMSPRGWVEVWERRIPGVQTAGSKARRGFHCHAP